MAKKTDLRRGLVRPRAKDAPPAREPLDDLLEMDVEEELTPPKPPPPDPPPRD